MLKILAKNNNGPENGTNSDGAARGRGRAGWRPVYGGNLTVEGVVPQHGKETGRGGRTTEHWEKHLLL